MKKEFVLSLILALSLPLAIAAQKDKKEDKNKNNAAAAGDAKSGEAVYAKNCALCHHADSEENKIGPGLKDLFKKEKLPSGAPADEKTVTQRINKGSEKMPAFEKKLSKKELADVITYLKTL